MTLATFKASEVAYRIGRGLPIAVFLLLVYLLGRSSRVPL